MTVGRRHPDCVGSPRQRVVSRINSVGRRSAERPSRAGRRPVGRPPCARAVHCLMIGANSKLTQKSTGMEIGLRACFKICRRPVFGQKAAWPRCSSVTDPWRVCSLVAPRHAAFCPKTLRAAGLLPVAGVGSFLTARCEDARNSPPWPRPKSLAAGPLLILKQALNQKGNVWP